MTSYSKYNHLPYNRINICGEKRKWRKKWVNDDVDTHIWKYIFTVVCLIMMMMWTMCMVELCVYRKKECIWIIKMGSKGWGIMNFRCILRIFWFFFLSDVNQIWIGKDFESHFKFLETVVKLSKVLPPGRMNDFIWLW